MMHVDGWTATGALGGRYVLRERLGAGRITTVYAADDVRLTRPVAVKILDTAGGVPRFAAEAQVLAGLSHPGLVTVYDVSLDTDPPYLVMPLIDGEPLRWLVDRDQLEPAAVARIGAQVAEVLAYVHARGVVHGDLHATNVLVDDEGTGYLTGFGTGGGLGGRAGDVYALGMMLAELLPIDLGSEWRATLAIMTHPKPGMRPDATRCAQLLRDVATGGTADIPLPWLADEQYVEPDTASAPESDLESDTGPGTGFDDESDFEPDAGPDVESIDEPVAVPAAVPSTAPQRAPRRVIPRRRTRTLGPATERRSWTTRAGLGGAALAATALGVLAVTASNNPQDDPAGGPPRAPAETTTTPNQQAPPVRYTQTPQPPAKGPAAPARPRHRSKTTVSTDTATTSVDDSGNGNGNGRGEGNGGGNGNGNGGLLGGILGGLL